MDIHKFFDEAKGSDKVPELKLSFKRSRLSSQKLDTTEKQVAFLQSAFDPDTFDIQEEIILLVLNDAYQPVCYYRLSKGGEGSVDFSKKTLFGVLLTLQASKFILSHNHPNKNPLPSYSDIVSTHSNAIIAASLGIEYIDDIIISRLTEEQETEEGEIEYPSHYSLMDNGHFFTGDFPG
jgi:DNA repair protein RadC